MKSVALFGHLGAGNLGNDASLEVCLRWFVTHAPDTHLTLITSDPEAAAARYGIPALPMVLYPPLGPAGLAHRLRRGAGRAVDAPRSLLLAHRFDAVIVPGMGVFDESLPIGPWGFPLTLAVLASACRAFRKPFVLLDVGAEDPVDRRLTRFFSHTARMASHISCRDDLSARVISPWIGSSPPVYPDLAFAHDSFLGVPASRPRHAVIGVIGGDWETAYHGSRRIESDYLSILEEVCVDLASRGCNVTLTGGDDADRPVADAVKTRILEARPDLEGSISVCMVQTFDELTSLMGQAGVVVASRYHNLLCALGCGRPTIAISYAQKCIDLLAAHGVGSSCHDIRQLNASSLLADLHSVLFELPRPPKGSLDVNSDRATKVLELLNLTLEGHGGD